MESRQTENLSSKDKSNKIREEALPLVSVIMPVYNSEQYLMGSVLSILEQTYQKVELICVDDGSTDASLFILNKIKDSYPDKRIKIITQENTGPAAARNKGLEAANGEYLAFVDSDDSIAPNTYMELVKEASQKNADIVVYGGSTLPNELPREHWITQKLSPQNKVYGMKDAGRIALLRENSAKPFMWQHFIKRSLIEAEPKLRMKEDFEIGEDQIFIFSYFPRAKRVVFTDKKLYHYRIRESGSIMNKYNSMKIRKFETHLGVVSSILSFWNQEKICDSTGEMVSYFERFLYNDYKNFPEYLKIKYAKEIIDIFNTYGFDPFICREYTYEIAKEIEMYAKKDAPDILESVNAMEVGIKIMENNIAAIMSSKAYKIGRFLTPRSKRLDEEWLTSLENKKIF